MVAVTGPCSPSAPPAFPSDSLYPSPWSLESPRYEDRSRPELSTALGSAGSQGIISPRAYSITVQEVVQGIPVDSVNPYLQAPAYNPDGDLQTLKKALSRAKADKRAIGDVLKRRSVEEIAVLRDAYLIRAGRPLIAALRETLSGRFRAAMLDLVMSRAELDAKTLHDGLSDGDMDAVMEVLGARSNIETDAARVSFGTVYGKSLDTAIKAKTSGDVSKLLLAIIEGRREWSWPVAASPYSGVEVARADAHKLHKDATKRWPPVFKEHRTAVEVFGSRTHSHIAAVAAEYRAAHLESLHALIQHRYPDPFRICCYHILQFATNEAAFYAQQLVKAINTKNDLSLIRLVVRVARLQRPLKDAVLATFHSIAHASIYVKIAERARGRIADLLLFLLA